MKNIDENLLNNFQNRIGYNFKNINLLIEALSHPSLKQLKDRSIYNDYERLEFLGDSILNFVITELLFNKFPDHDEGRLAKIRSSLVRKETLWDVGKILSVENMLIMTQGEELSGGRTNKSNIENAMEAIIGSIYLDSNIDQVRNFILRLWSDFLDKDYRMIDPKSSLQEWSQGRSMAIPNYIVVNRVGESHSPIFTVKVAIGNLEPEYGEGRSIKEAEKAAALKLLSRLIS